MANKHGETMRAPVTEEQIRTLAFSLWEAEGSPEGRSEEFWEKARQQLGEDEDVDSIPESNESDAGPAEQTRRLSE
jgi:hypothetical protein